jgi:hypothetical protein
MPKRPANTKLTITAKPLRTPRPCPSDKPTPKRELKRAGYESPIKMGVNLGQTASPCLTFPPLAFPRAWDRP